MLVYLAIYAIFAAMGVGLARQSQQKLVPWVLGFLLLFMGTRYYVGCDFTGYLHRFQLYVLNIRDQSTLPAQEGGFEFLTGLIAGLGLEFYWLNIIATLIILVAYYPFLRNSPYPMLMLTLMFPVLIVQLSMSGVRQGITVAMVALASLYFVKREPIKTAIPIFIGMFFHTAVIMFLPMAVLAKFRISGPKLIAGIVVAVPVIAFFMIDRFSVYQDRYIDQIYGEVESGGAYLRYFLLLIPAALYWFTRKQVEEHYPQLRDLFFLFALIIVAMAPTGLISTLILHRLTFYVMPVSILMFTVCSMLFFSARNKALGLLAPVIVYTVYLLGWFILSKHGEVCYIPYNSYLFL